MEYLDLRYFIKISIDLYRDLLVNDKELVAGFNILEGNKDIHLKKPLYRFRLF